VESPAVTVPHSGRGERDRDDEAGPLSLAALVRAVGNAALSFRGSGIFATAAPHGVWQWPFAGQPRVVKHFDPPDRPWLPGHRGIDLAGLVTSPVLAVDAGTVTYSGSIAGVGIVSVTHGDGIRSTYQPVSDRISRGAQVRAGDRIGQLGEFGSHCLLRACLHLGAVRGDRDYVNPLLFLQGWELSLLPHGT
jgi:murein DD-endopeptidase MepM/ murein hydrolase activator NlpD